MIKQKRVFASIISIYWCRKCREQIKVYNKNPLPKTCPACREVFEPITAEDYFK